MARLFHRLNVLLRLSGYTVGSTRVLAQQNQLYKQKKFVIKTKKIWKEWRKKNSNKIKRDIQIDDRITTMTHKQCMHFCQEYSKPKKLMNISLRKMNNTGIY